MHNLTPYQYKFLQDHYKNMDVSLYAQIVEKPNKRAKPNKRVKRAKRASYNDCPYLRLKKKSILLRKKIASYFIHLRKGIRTLRMKLASWISPRKK